MRTLHDLPFDKALEGGIVDLPLANGVTRAVIEPQNIATSEGGIPECA